MKTDFAAFAGAARGRLIPNRLVRGAMAMGLMSLAGCTTIWTKPGASTEAFTAAQADCQTQARSHVPPMMHMMQAGSGTPAPIEVECHPEGGATNCIGHYVKPATMLIDRRESDRQQYVRSCLMQSGWSRGTQWFGG
jgi:hypothetical protein